MKACAAHARGHCANGACACVATDYRLSGSTTANACRCRAFSSASAAANSASVSTSGGLRMLGGSQSAGRCAATRSRFRSSMGQRWAHIVSVTRLIKGDVPQRVTRVPEVDEYKPAYCHARASTDRLYAASRKTRTLFGCGKAKKAKFCCATVETPAARRRRSLLRLSRRAFIGGLRYGEGRLHTKDAGDALRQLERDRARFALLLEPKRFGGNALRMIRVWRE